MKVDPAEAYTAGRSVLCDDCGSSERLERRVEAGHWRREVVLMHRASQSRREIGPPTPEETRQADSPQWHPSLALGPIPEARETNVLLRHGFRTWGDLYPKRQAFVLGRILREVAALPVKETVRAAVTLAVLGAAEMAGHVSRWDRWYLKCYELTAGHRFAFTTLSAEPNVWGIGRIGRGSVQNRLAMLLKAASWLAERRKSRRVRAVPAPIRDGSSVTLDNTDALIVTGSSTRVPLLDDTVDLVLTDPPYYDDLQYGQLAMPYREWLRAHTDREREPSQASEALEAQPNVAQYSELLASILSESRRVVRDEGRVILTFANRRVRTWWALLEAVAASGLYPLAYTIVRSENPADYGKRGVRACQASLALELAPTRPDPGVQHRATESDGGPEMEALVAIGESFLMIGHQGADWKNWLAAQLGETGDILATGSGSLSPTETSGTA